MPDTTITSANSVVTLTCSPFPQGYQLSGYSADRAWESNGIEMSQSQMGVDGRKTAGYVFNQVEQTFSLQADSPARLQFLNTLINAQKAAREVIYISGRIELPSTGESFVCVRGTLKTGKSIPDAARVLQAVDFTIEWESVNPTLS